MRQSRTLDIGLEVHQDSMAVADSAQEHHAEGVALGNLGTRPGDLDHLLRTLQSTSQPRILVDEAGPGGSWLDRSLTQTGQVCGVVAPALIPHKPGDRVQTHRRAAITRARRRRSGDLPPVDVPTVDDAAMRDPGPGRADAIRALTTAPCRLNALRLRPASRDPGRATWGPAPLRWRSAVVCPPPAPPLVCQDDRRAVTEHPARRTRLDGARRDQGQTWRRAPVVDALQARRGVPCTVAVTTGAERGDRTRCDHPRPLMHSRGVTPAADATGARRRPGGSPRRATALPAGRWAKAPGPIATPPTSAGIGRDAWRRGPSLSTISVGRPRDDGAHATDTARQREQRPPGGRRHRAGMECVSGGHGQAGRADAIAPDHGKSSRCCPAVLIGQRERARPRCGAPLDGVKRRQHTRVPRARPAPDGRPSGGNPSTAIRMSTRRL